MTSNPTVILRPQRHPAPPASSCAERSADAGSRLRSCGFRQTTKSLVRWLAVPAVIRKPKTLPEKVKEKGISKLVFPKASQILTNVIQLGPRVVLRSTTQLLRVNPLTRIVSVTSLTFIDIFLLAKKKISLNQFFINLTYSLTMFAGSTIGWYAGRFVATQFALDVALAFAVSLVFLLIGNKTADALTRSVVSRVAITDCERGLAEINQHCPADKYIAVSKDACIEVFRLHDDAAKTQCIQQVIAEAELLPEPLNVNPHKRDVIPNLKEKTKWPIPRLT